MYSFLKPWFIHRDAVCSLPRMMGWCVLGSRRGILLVPCFDKSKSQQKINTSLLLIFTAIWKHYLNIWESESHPQDMQAITSVPVLLCFPPSFGTVSAGPGCVVTTLSYAAEPVTLPFLHRVLLVFITHPFLGKFRSPSGCKFPCAVHADLSVHGNEGPLCNCVCTDWSLHGAGSSTQTVIVLSLFTCAYIFAY